MGYCVQYFRHFQGYLPFYKGYLPVYFKGYGIFGTPPPPIKASELALVVNQQVALEGFYLTEIGITRLR